MIEDATGNIKRLIDGLADEIAERCDVDIDLVVDPLGVIKSHSRQVLLDWFLGDFIPGRK